MEVGSQICKVVKIKKIKIFLLIFELPNISLLYL